MPISDRIRHKNTIAEGSRFRDFDALDLTADGQIFLLDLANHNLNRLLAEENRDEIADLPKVEYSRPHVSVRYVMKYVGRSLPQVKRSGLVIFTINERVGTAILEYL